MNLATGDPVAHRFREFHENVGATVVGDGVNRIEPKAVELKFLKPIKRVMHDEIAHRTAARAIIVDRRAPWRVMPLGKEIRGHRGQVITLRAEVVVDDIEQDREAARMAGFDKGLQIVRPAVAGSGRIKLDAVIAPVAPAGERADRHQLDRGHTQIAQIVEPAESPREIAARRKGAEMEFVYDEFLPGTAVPAGVVPAIGRSIDHLARTMHAFRLKAGSGTRPRHPVDRVAIARSRPGAVRRQRKPAARLALHPQLGSICRFPLEPQGNGGGTRRPQAEANAIAAKFGPERQFMLDRHRFAGKRVHQKPSGARLLSSPSGGSASSASAGSISGCPSVSCHSDAASEAEVRPGDSGARLMNSAKLWARSRYASPGSHNRPSSAMPLGSAVSTRASQSIGVASCGNRKSRSPW